MSQAKTRLRQGTPVIFTDVAGRERETMVSGPPVNVGQLWFVPLALGPGLFTANRVRLIDEPPIPPPSREPAYAGIGSRARPGDVLFLMRRLAEHLAKMGYILRSGGAQGADEAFEDGARAAGGATEIFIPWPNFQGKQPSRDAGVFCFAKADINIQAQLIASRHHPAWAKLSPSVRQLMARNAHQALGQNLDHRAAFICCWAPDPVVEDERVIDARGGTGLAIRIAAAGHIPVFNLVIPAHRERIERLLQRKAA